MSTDCTARVYRCLYTAAMTADASAPRGAAARPPPVASGTATRARSWPRRNAVVVLPAWKSGFGGDRCAASGTLVCTPSTAKCRAPSAAARLPQPISARRRSAWPAWGRSTSRPRRRRARRRRCARPGRVAARRRAAARSRAGSRSPDPRRRGAPRSRGRAARVAPARSGSGSPAAIRDLQRTRSSPVTISVTGCSTCRRVFISRK